MKKKYLYICILIILGIIIITSISFANKISKKEYTNNDFTIEYDSTWKIDNEDNGLKLIHKKTKSILHIQCMELEDNYIDTNLSTLIDDIIYSIQSQNTNYKLINTLDNTTDNYESYSYLYEDDLEQVLVNIYKKDTKIIIVYYSANSEYYDIVLDSVDYILESLVIHTGEILE